MIKKLKVMTVVGTRPEIIRLSRVISKLDAYCDHVLVHTGQNFDYELNRIFFDDLGVREPDIFLDAADASAAATIANVISRVDFHLAKGAPDALLVLGDTNSCMAVIAAKRRKIPIFHMEAGNRCYDVRVPEEINRRIVDHTSDVNLTYSDIARECLLREGLAPDLIIKTGSPMREVLDYYKFDIEKSDVLDRFGLNSGNYFLVSCHREENLASDHMFNKFIAVLNFLGEKDKFPVLVSAHPRLRQRVSSMVSAVHPNVRFEKPFGFFDYVKLQTEACVVLSDSGTISEEASLLNFRALNIREAQERHEAFEEGSVMLVGLNLERIGQALEILSDQPCGLNRLLRPVVDYDVPNVSDKVVRIVHSYTDYVNRVVWRRY